jgi:hypothetical protein
MRTAIRPSNWRLKGLLRILLLGATAIAIAALASFFGVARDYGSLRAALLSGTPEGRYHALATNLAAHASRGHGRITVVATAGSGDNVGRLAKQERCTSTFAFAQDGFGGSIQHVIARQGFCGLSRRRHLPMLATLWRKRRKPSHKSPWQTGVWVDDLRSPNLHAAHRSRARIRGTL